MDLMFHENFRNTSTNSVIGFDDSIDASFHRLTSYSFNGTAVMRAMLMHIIDPARGPGAVRPDRPVEIPGFITQRETSGPPRS